MATTVEPRARSDRAELWSWYLASLRPKVADAASSGAIPPATMAELDRLVGELVDEPTIQGEEAA